MKKILIILTLLFSLSASAQVDTTKQIQTISANGYAYKHLQAIYALILPTDTLGLKSDWRGIAFKDTLPYFWTGRAFRPFGTGSGSSMDTTVFHSTTYHNTLYPQLSGSYANPSWVSSLAWSKITGTPTTLSGYGITDAVPSSRTITINGTTYDLSANRSWTVSGSGQASRFDSSYTPLGGNRGSEYIVKSIRIRRNSITVTPTQIGDSAMYWDISVPTTYIDSMRRVGLNWQAYKNGAWETIGTDSVGSGGGGGSPAGNYGNVQLNRNGSFATPGSDSLNFLAGLYIKGSLSATALAIGGANTDSLVMVTSSGEFKKRNVSAFARMNTTSAANQLALFNGNGTLYSSSKFVFSDATYPSMSIVGSDPLMYFGGTGAAYPSIGKSGNSIAIYGPSTGKSIGFYDQLVGGKQMLRLYTTSGSVATFSKTAITLDTAVGGPSIGSVHVEYNAGDSTSAGTDVGRHMFRGIGRTYANAGSFNTFYSTVEAGNTTYSQDHIISWQSDAKKTGANTLNIIYHLGILGDSIKAGTVNNRWGVYMYDAKVTAGATLAHQSALRVPKLASGVRNYDMFSDSAQTVKMDGNLLIGDSSLATGARKTIHLFNGTAPSSNISGSILYSESGEFKIRNSSGAINTLSGNAVFSGTVQTADPGSGAGAFKFGQFHSSSGLILNTSGYVEINIGGTVYWLALVTPPQP